MKKMILASLMAAAVGLAFAPSLPAGPVVMAPAGQPAGNALYDSANYQGITSVMPRGWTCGLWVQFAALSGSSSVVNLSAAAGVEAAYVGPVRILARSIEPAQALLVYTGLTPTAMGDTTTAKGIELAPTTSTYANLRTPGMPPVWDSGPLTRNENAHFRGLSGTSNGQYCACAEHR